MAKTALFKLLRRAMRQADGFNHLNCSTQTGIEQGRQHRINRRTLLKATALATVGTTLGGRLQAQNINPIVIIGAGLAGLTTAYRLEQSGFPVQVYDANTRTGGRTFSLTDFFPNDQKCELGGEFIDSGHLEIQTLVQELGLTLTDLTAATAQYEPERYYFGGVRVTEAQIIEEFRPVARRLRQDFMKQGRPFFATYDNYSAYSRQLDLLSITDWLDLNGVHGTLRELLRLAYVGEYGLEAEEQSFLNMLYLIGLTPDPFLLFGDSDERYTVLEGNQAISDRIIAGLGNPITLEHRLDALYEKRDGSYRLTFSAPSGNTEITARKVVLALPFNQLRKVATNVIFPEAKQKSIYTLRYGTNAKLMVGTLGRIWYDYDSSGTSFSDLGYIESWETSRGLPGSTAVLTNFTGGVKGLQLGTGSTQAQAQGFLNQIDQVYPGVKARYTDQAVRFHWPTAVNFEGSYGCYTPGDWTTFVGSEPEIVGGLHFAGEHTSYDYQGYMNGAVQSGERVAREIRTLS